MNRRPNKVLIVAVVVVVLALAGLAAFFFMQYMNVKNNPNAVSEEVTKRLVEKIGKLYQLPSDEQPTVAEVKDKDKLKDQAFFANAENGDYLLIYTKAKTAIIFREKTNKIINVGPIAIDQNQQSQTQTQKVSVKVLNGTTKTGRAAELGTTLTSKLSDLVNVDSTYGDAKKKTITKTLVVDVNKNKSEAAQKVADAVGGQVGDLPAGEDKPTTDIVVFAGP